MPLITVPLSTASLLGAQDPRETPQPHGFISQMEELRLKEGKLPAQVTKLVLELEEFRPSEISLSPLHRSG